VSENASATESASLGEQIERLAHHALRGELGEKAVHDLRQPGIKAGARSALPGARGWFEKVLGILRSATGDPRWSKPARSASSWVLGPIVHEQQQARRSQALDQAIEQRLGLAVDPVEVLEDQEERLLSGLSQQQPPHGVERALTTLPRSRVPHAVASSAGTSAPLLQGVQKDP
jgi:hypothetical protein